VGSDDINLIPFLKRFYLNGMFDYIELYLLKTTTIYQLHSWLNSGIHIPILQAAHNGKAEIDSDSIKNAMAAVRFFHAGRIVFDPGTDLESLNETVMDDVLIPENMPLKTSFGTDGVLSLPEEMPENFCLDFSHAWITAEMFRLDPKRFIQRFLNKKPVHFHLTDTRDYEDHLPLGEGYIDLEFIFQKVPTNSTITIETDHEPRETREERIISDLLIAKKYENSGHNTGKG